MKSLLNTKGAQKLSKDEQQSINGGGNSVRGCSPEACAATYNQTAFVKLPSSSFICVNGICEFV